MKKITLLSVILLLLTAIDLPILFRYNRSYRRYLLSVNENRQVVSNPLQREG